MGLFFSVLAALTRQVSCFSCEIAAQHHSNAARYLAFFARIALYELIKLIARSVLLLRTALKASQSENSNNFRPVNYEAPVGALSHSSLTFAELSLLLW